MKTLHVFVLFLALSVLNSYAASPAEMVGESLLDSRGRTAKAEELNQKKLVGYYFSASWCGPCRAFTPELVKFYKRNKDDIEIILVGRDKSEKAQQEYIRDFRMPWKAVKWGSLEANAISSQYYEGGIPRLVIVDNQGNLISEQGRKDLVYHPKDALKNWLAQAEENQQKKK